MWVVAIGKGNSSSKLNWLKETKFTMCTPCQLVAVMHKIIVFTHNNTQDPMVHLPLDPMCFI